MARAQLPGVYALLLMFTMSTSRVAAWGWSPSSQPDEGCSLEAQAAAEDAVIAAVGIPVGVGIEQIQNAVAKQAAKLVAPRLVDAFAHALIVKSKSPKEICQLGESLLPMAREITGANPYIKGSLQKAAGAQKLLDVPQLKKLGMKASAALLKRLAMEKMAAVGDIAKDVVSGMTWSDYKFGDITRGILSKLPTWKNDPPPPPTLWARLLGRSPPPPPTIWQGLWGKQEV
jgi:hypothetical protein